MTRSGSSSLGSIALGVAGFCAAIAACSGESAPPTAARRGEIVYQNVCVACHNGDPAKDGSLGPALAGSSRELLEARVIRGEYPTGYTPQRPLSETMPRFEYLADKIDDLHAFLAQSEAG